MGKDENEPKRIRSAALEDPESLLAARRRAEEEVVAAKESLERTTQELEQQRERFAVTERALRASEERLRATFSQAAVGIAIANLEARFVEANQKFCEILGYTLEELQQRTFLELTHPDDVAETGREVARLRAGEIAAYVLEKRYLRKDGQDSAARPPARRRVLVADDNRDAAESLAMLLRIDGHDVTVVHDGEEALATFTSARPQVALLDIGMPKMNGYDVARRIREDSLGRAVTLVAVTGWGQDTDKERALAVGFDYHFTKPVDPERLCELLRSEQLASD